MKTYIPTRTAASERYWVNTCIISKNVCLFLFSLRDVCKQPTRTAASDKANDTCSYHTATKKHLPGFASFLLWNPSLPIAPCETGRAQPSTFSFCGVANTSLELAQRLGCLGHRQCWDWFSTVDCSHSSTSSNMFFCLSNVLFFMFKHGINQSMCTEGPYKYSLAKCGTKTTLTKQPNKPRHSPTMLPSTLSHVYLQHFLLFTIIPRIQQSFNILLVC